MDPLSFLAFRFYYFFRDPPRRPPAGRHLLSPADGVVLYVHRVEADGVPSPVKKGVRVPLDEWLGAVDVRGPGTLVGIYMTPLSVHYNRAPIAGAVRSIVQRPARERNLSMTRAFMRILWDLPPFEEGSRYILENARCTTVIEGDLRVAVTQIADAYVRQIDSFVAEGQRLSAGEKFGMIRMGSQCDLFVPDRPSVRIVARPGDRVRAGESILGSY